METDRETHWLTARDRCPHCGGSLMDSVRPDGLRCRVCEAVFTVLPNETLVSPPGAGRSRTTDPPRRRPVDPAPGETTPSLPLFDTPRTA